MTAVAEVRDLIEIVAQGINNIRTIITAVQDGREYLRRRHPGVKKDLAIMLGEMQKTAQAIAAASAIITNFRFTISGSASESEPARFNEHLMHYKTQAMDVTTQLNALRGRCGIIAEHAHRLNEAVGQGGLSSLFGKKSKSRDRDLQLALERIYDDEMQYHENVYGMREMLQRALDDIQESLGAPGAMEPTNVRRAATKLGAYAQKFSKLESTANYTVYQLQELISDLG